MGAVQTKLHGVHENIPPIFCWTKMGAEAGQSLDAIRRRKELERRSGGGIFAWGIGNSLGNSALLAKEVSHNGQVDVLFTPMKSAPKSIDAEPSELLLWLSYFNSSGQIVELPRHMLITSRGGSGKKAHYALLCRSEQDIAENEDAGVFNATFAKNLVSSNPVGASQVTSIVKYERGACHKEPKNYQVSFRAKLHAEGFVRLTSPVPLTATLRALYEKMCSATSAPEWRLGAHEIRTKAQKILLKDLHANGLFAG